MIFGLSGRVLTKDTDTKGRFSSPVLDVTEKQLIIERNQTLQLNCRGRWELHWVLPSGIPKVYHGTQIEETGCGKKNNQYCSRLTLSPALAQHTGSYRCRYRQKQRKQASVIGVSDSQQPFVKVQSEIPDVVYMKEGEPLVFPCRVTNPDAKVSLVKESFHFHRLVPDYTNIIWNSRQGFTIRSPTFFYIGLFSCETIVNGVKYSNKFLTHRQVNKILDVYLNSTGLVHTLQGQMLALNCTVTAEWNTRVSISWTYPQKANGSANIIRRISKSRTKILFYSVLTIPRLSKADRGLYKCHVASGPSKRETNTTVIVYDQPFIRLKHRDGPVVQASAGQKSFRLTPKLRAFPAPEVIWLKDGMVAAEQCSRYHVNGFSLVIRDVAEEDAGIYTILTGIQQYGLYQNLTLKLVVNVKPQIGEKTVSSQQPGTVQRGSRQALHCTSHGVPPPQIQWLWHPCPPKVLLNFLAIACNSFCACVCVCVCVCVFPQTVGVLTVGQALISGIYRCVASNSMGRDELDMRFYVTDVKGGLIASLEEEPREGGDLRLVCIANRHLYSDLSWYRLTNQSTTSEGASVLGGELKEGQFSHTLQLLLKNVTAQDSGTYRCSATHLLTGEHTHLDTAVEVTVLQAPVLLQNLSDHSVNVSKSVTLRCPTLGIPHPRITWYKDQRKLQRVSGIMLFPEEGTLHIDRITVEDQGLYTCKATNERGSVESSAHIWVQSSSESLSLEIPTLACTCVVATLFWLLLTLLIRKLKQPNSTNGKAEYLPIILHPGEEPLVGNCDRLQYDPAQWEFPRDRLKLGKLCPLGRGAFGRVMQASAFGICSSASCTTVAVKMLKDGATPSEHKALMTELKILNHIGHHLNVVNLLGACTKPGGPLMIIVEYCKFGNLSAYLKSKREVFLLNRVKEEGGMKEGYKGRLASVSSSQSNASSGFSEEKGEISEEDSSLPEYSSPLLLEDLISYSFQVARGMEFLASRKCIHRDLAARNILLSNNNVVKICDFGLARDVYKDPDYVRKGDARLPLKWMAPESIFDKVFTAQSDVWSYGVLLWEIFSLGASPYPGLNIDEEFCHRLKQGTRMCPPEYSIPEIYCIMMACWENNPEDRPSFSALVEILGDLLQTCVQQVGHYLVCFYTSSGKIKAISTFEDLHKEIPDVSVLKIYLNFTWVKVSRLTIFCFVLCFNLTLGQPV
uniref:receptor protein-tyrosine kinase n=2 Tax=Cyprinus carpio TaxID=7962 RepID=A0A8C1HXY4_CYPCA